jgi:hypothetical protein
MDSPRGAVFDGKTLYVMHPPNLTAYTDTNGDGIADESHDIVQGLGFDLDFRGADHTTNQIVMGIDGWIYVAVGDYGYRKAVGTDGTQISHRGGSVVRVRPDGTHLEIYATGTRNIYDVAIDPFMHLFARDNTNDGDGWNTRLHYLPPGAFMGYPTRYQNFDDEHFPSLFDYGAGAGVGSVYVQDPALPAGYNNTLYTGDWTVNKIFRHPLTAKGSSYGVDQQEFLTVVRPSDIIVDGASNFYVASLSGGQFTYASDTVGYVFRVSAGGGQRVTKDGAGAAAAAGQATDAQLLAMLGAPNAITRLHAAQELVRRGAKDATVRGVQALMNDAKQTPEVRAAALFTLKQLDGVGANAALVRAAADANPLIREAALRALADRPEEAANVDRSLFTKALADADMHVRVQALNGLVRLGATNAVDAIAQLAGSDDQGMAYLAQHALVVLDGRDAALRVVDTGSPAARKGALRALAMMHDDATVTALLARVSKASDPAARGALLHTLGRLYNQEGYWAGDWWTTRPAHLGPYFDPAAWQGSARIRPVLTAALVSASGATFDSLAADLARNQVMPRGGPAFLAALPANDPQRPAMIEALVGRTQLDATTLALAQQLDAKSPALHAAVARLLAGVSALGASAIPLVRTAVLDPKLDPATRAELLGAVSQIPGPAGLDAAAEIFSRLNPVPGMSAAATPAAAASASPTPAGANAIEGAWRRYVGDRRRMAELDRFIQLAKTGTPAQRTLAYAVLVQSVRTPRTPPPVRERVAPVIEAAWTDPASTPSLVQAITIMKVESQYADKLQAVAKPQK